MKIIKRESFRQVGSRHIPLKDRFISTLNLLESGLYYTLVIFRPHRPAFNSGSDIYVFSYGAGPPILHKRGFLCVLKQVLHTI